MGTAKISKYLFNRNNRAKKQYDELVVEKNLYTILGFKSGEDFEHKTNKFVSKKIWQLFIDCFAKEIDYVGTKQVVENIVCDIAKSGRGNAFTKTKHLILNEKQDSEKRRKAIKEAIGILRKVSPEKAFHELSAIKKQAEDFLKNAQETQEEDQKKRAELKKKFVDNTQSTNILPTTETIGNFRRSQEELLRQFGLAGPQLFVEILRYIKTLEKLSEVKKEELIKDFLLSHISSFDKTCPKSHGKREDAIAILSNNELRSVYDKGVEEGVLYPIASYKECKNLFDKMNQAKDEYVIKREELEVNLRETGKSIASIISEIIKHREGIFNCKDLQNSYIQEKKEHPFRGSACQKMIDIYQERIAGYQEKICQNLTQIREILQGIPQDIRGAYDLKNFEELMDNIHEAKQVDENFDSALSNIQNKLNTPLEKMKNPSTELKETSHINGKTEVTRL
ncbi:hypothetical protein [Wolbachia endosymbiont of Ctenocephalides felis wCfeJ]|uniref:hypothetical protein n=1 Tax=Wolbachia endosymbiont of Ctenocephalides felis wCfeJ TaxID=2732594 RepID=UPI001444C574|nr:hypothetical protein [Wolbachia endosymbiont of Ctenocephalides felis wCfeJ]WCR58548.1 MAG: hypothetical protein PG980_001020 [Wolbachia endosymbiont of Ctenocephalides felis wCfeJ]